MSRRYKFFITGGKMKKIRRLQHDMKCLADRVKQANFFYLPHLGEVIKWLTCYDEELKKLGINVDFDRHLNFNYRTILAKERARLEYAEQVLKGLRTGQIIQNRQTLLDRAYHSLGEQRGRIDDSIYKIEDVRYDIEEKYSSNAMKAAARADMKCGYYFHNHEFEYTEISLEDVLEETPDE